MKIDVNVLNPLSLPQRLRRLKYVIMEIRKVRQDEYEMLIDVMNKSFGFVDAEAKFEHILPKLYRPDNAEMIHFGAFEGENLVSSVGLYPLMLINGGKTVSSACVGAVSTLPEYRGRGLFTKVMDQLLLCAREMRFDLLYLGGNRLRYGRFGFEYGGRNLTVHISGRTRALLSPSAFEVVPYDEQSDADLSVAKEILGIYERAPMRAARTADKLYSTLCSWNCKPYYVVDGRSASRRIVGYFAVNGESVSEIGFTCDIDTIFAALISVCGNAEVTFPMSFYTPEVLARVDHYGVSQNHMFKILNEDAVIRFLGAEPAAICPLLSDDRHTRIRQILGDSAFDSVTGTNIFISGADSA